MTRRPRQGLNREVIAPDITNFEITNRRCGHTRGGMRVPRGFAARYATARRAALREISANEC